MQKSLIHVISALFFLSLVAGCSNMKVDALKELAVLSTVYNVVFEDKPALDSDKVYARGFEIGSILSQELADNGRVVIKISVDNEHKKLMTENAVFYADEGRLEYDTVGESGKNLQEGAKILGFTGKTGLYWFKTKNKFNDLSGAALQQAQELYDSAFK